MRHQRQSWCRRNTSLSPSMVTHKLVWPRGIPLWAKLSFSGSICISSIKLCCISLYINLAHARNDTNVFYSWLIQSLSFNTCSFLGQNRKNICYLAKNVDPATHFHVGAFFRLPSCQCAGNRHGLERGLNGSIAFEMNVTFKIQDFTPNIRSRVNLLEL